MAIVSFVLNVAIGFWTSPFIVAHLGTEAYGFSNLGGNFTTYMSLMTVAVNAFAARYITIAVHDGDDELASRYFTSVFYANTIIALVMLLPISIIVLNLEHIFSISSELVPDVKLQWIILFGAWLLELLFKVFSTATFVRNRLDINHRLTAVSNVLRLLVLLVMFSFFPAHVWYIGLAALICAGYVIIGYVRSKRKLLPQVRIRRNYFDWQCLKTLVVKGVWNSINQLAALLMNGFDLVITNLAVDSIAMGLYSVAQLIPTYLQSLMYTLCDLFNPNLTVSYAKGKYGEVRDGLTFAMRFNALLLLVPLLGFFVYGRDFFALWQYSLNEQAIRTVFILSTLVILPMISGVFVQPLLTINTITAKLRIPVYVNIVIGILNIVIELILVKTTDMGVYAIAGVSSVLLLIRNYLFYPIYCAKQINMPRATFYPTILRGTAVGAVCFAFLYVTHALVKVTSWGTLIAYALLFGLAAEGIVFMLLLGKQERAKVVQIIQARVLRKRS